MLKIFKHLPRWVKIPGVEFFGVVVLTAGHNMILLQWERTQGCVTCWGSGARRPGVISNHSHDSPCRHHTRITWWWDFVRVLSVFPVCWISICAKEDRCKMITFTNTPLKNTFLIILNVLLTHYASRKVICFDQVLFKGCNSMHHMGQVTKLWLSWYLVLLSIDSKTR